MDKIILEKIEQKIQDSISNKDEIKELIESVDQMIERAGGPVNEAEEEVEDDETRPDRADPWLSGDDLAVAGPDLSVLSKLFALRVCMLTRSRRCSRGLAHAAAPSSMSPLASGRI